MSSRARSQKGERRYTEPAVGKLGVMKRQWVVNRWWTVAGGTSTRRTRATCLIEAGPCNQTPRGSTRATRETRGHGRGSAGSTRLWQLSRSTGAAGPVSALTSVLAAHGWCWTCRESEESHTDRVGSRQRRAETGCYRRVPPTGQARGWSGVTEIIEFNVGVSRVHVCRHAVGSVTGGRSRETRTLRQRARSTV